MSQLLINDYLKQLDIIKKVSGSQRETIVREAFKDLLKNWGKQQDLIFLAEYPVRDCKLPFDWRESVATFDSLRKVAAGRLVAAWQ